jgi:signal transduction histidine kinase
VTVATRSLRLRLLVIAALAIALALFVSGSILARLFRLHIEEREFAELANHQSQIVAAVQIDGDGQLGFATEPADPRFFAPNGGLYWQIEMPDGSKQRSRSLWETELVLPRDELQDGAPHRHTIDGPNGTMLLALERGLIVGPDSKPLAVRLTVAVDQRDIVKAASDFRAVLARSLSTLGLALLAALFVQVEFGLRPLARLRTALQRVHGGEVKRVVGAFPTEVQPLVEDMNALLDRERETNIKARERAGDLAHGFKTPLAVLSAVSRDLQRDGRSQSAADIDTQIDIMSRHVRRELARARTVGASAIGQPDIAVRPVLDKIVSALGRIASDRSLTWTVTADPAVIFTGDENDLLEMVGNLAENAAKWAISKIQLRASRTGGTLELVVEDDGPGVPESAQAEILVRGRRLDETGDGSGLGLSIVAKIVETYGGTLTIGRSSSGGLAATIRIAGSGRA